MSRAEAGIDMLATGVVSARHDWSRIQSVIQAGSRLALWNVPENVTCFPVAAARAMRSS